MNGQLLPLGIVWAVWSSVTAVIGAAVALVALGFGGLMTHLPDATSGEPAPAWVGFLFGGLGLIIGVLFALVGVLGIVVGVGITKGQRWALFTACVLGFLQLSNFPIGTALAIWTFVVAGRELTRSPD